jgi:DNA-binding transcriptional LysR family regulator
VPAGRWSVRAALRVNNVLMMRDFSNGRAGPGPAPDLLAHSCIAHGSLIPTDVGAEAEGSELHIAYPRDRSASAKIAALTASLRRSFGDPPYWDRV